MNNREKLKENLTTTYITEESPRALNFGGMLRTRFIFLRLKLSVIDTYVVLA